MIYTVFRMVEKSYKDIYKPKKIIPRETAVDDSKPTLSYYEFISKYKLVIITIIFLVFSYFTINSKPGDFLFFGKSTYEYVRQIFLTSSESKANFQTNLISSRIDDFVQELDSGDCVQAKLVEANIISNLTKLSARQNEFKNNKKISENFSKLSSKYSKFKSLTTNCNLDYFYLVAEDVLKIISFEEITSDKLEDMKLQIEQLEGDFAKYKLVDLATLSDEDSELISSFFTTIESNLGFIKEMSSSGNYFRAGITIFETNMLFQYLDNSLQNGFKEFTYFRDGVDFICTLSFGPECEIDTREATWNSILSNKNILAQFSLGKQQFELAINRYYSYVFNIE